MFLPIEQYQYRTCTEYTCTLLLITTIAIGMLPVPLLAGNAMQYCNSLFSFANTYKKWHTANLVFGPGSLTLQPAFVTSTSWSWFHNGWGYPQLTRLPVRQHFHWCIIKSRIGIQSGCLEHPRKIIDLSAGRARWHACQSNLPVWKPWMAGPVPGPGHVGRARPWD